MTTMEAILLLGIIIVGGLALLFLYMVIFKIDFFRKLLGILNDKGDTKNDDK